jgi:hypothetical protein
MGTIACCVLADFAAWSGPGFGSDSEMERVQLSRDLECDRAAQHRGLTWLLPAPSPRAAVYVDDVTGWRGPDARQASGSASNAPATSGRKAVASSG